VSEFRLVSFTVSRIVPCEDGDNQDAINEAWSQIWEDSDPSNSAQGTTTTVESVELTEKEWTDYCNRKKDGPYGSLWKDHTRLPPDPMDPKDRKEGT
jgi:hypothetical protein